MAPRVDRDHAMAIEHLPEGREIVEASEAAMQEQQGGQILATVVLEVDLGIARAHDAAAGVNESGHGLRNVQRASGNHPTGRLP